MFFKSRHTFFYTRRIAQTVNLKRERQIGIVSRIAAALFLCAGLIFVIVYSFQGGATTALLYPEACSGTWIQPAHAQGKPDLSFNASADAFTVDNSAFVVQNTTDQKQIFCSNFLGDSLLASSSPQLVTLRLSWAIGAKDHTSSSTQGGIVQQLINFAPSSQVLEQIASSSTASPTASSSVPTSSASSVSPGAPSAAGQGSIVNATSSVASSSSSTASDGQTSSSSPAHTISTVDTSSQSTASTSPSSAPAVPATPAPSVSSSLEPAPVVWPVSAPASTTGSVPSLPPPPAPVTEPASSSTSLLWNMFSPFFLQAFAQEVSTTPLVDATASTPVLISASPVASSSPLPAVVADQLSATATTAGYQSASTSTPAVSLSVSSPTTTATTTASSSPQTQPSVPDSYTVPSSSATSSADGGGAGDGALSLPIISATSASATSFLATSSPAATSSAAGASSTASSTTIDPTSAPHEGATSTPAIPMFEIRYSLDGSTWSVLADVTQDQMGQSFIVPVSSNDDIGKLQIAIVTINLSPLSLDQAVYLDGMTLQVTYPNEKKQDINQLSSGRKQLISSDGAFDSTQLRDDDFSRAGAGTVGCLADPFSQSINTTGTAQYAIDLSGPPDAQFDFAGRYAVLTAASTFSTSTPTDALGASTSSATTTPGAAVQDVSTTGIVGRADASSSLGASSSASVGAAMGAGGSSTPASSDSLTVADAAASLAHLMPFMITLGDYPQGITPTLSQDASGTPLISFLVDKTALPGSYTMIVRAMAKYHGQLEKGLCQLNLIVK